MSEQETWKRKYRALALELEQSQLQHQKAEAQLKHLLATMTIPLQGKDSLLDEDLMQLRGALQPEEGPVADLKPLADSIQHKIRLLDNQREKRAKAMLTL